MNWHLVMTDDFGPPVYFVAVDHWWATDVAAAKVFTDVERAAFEPQGVGQWVEAGETP